MLPFGREFAKAVQLQAVYTALQLRGNNVNGRCIHTLSLSVCAGKVELESEDNLPLVGITPIQIMKSGMIDKEQLTVWAL